jgi:large subunit ribosomal protein L18
VFRSGQHIYAQLIDDSKGVTLASASSLDKDIKAAVKSTSTVEAAKAVGASIAKKAKTAKVELVVFDRGGYLFHGRVKALADAARENGLAF